MVYQSNRVQVVNPMSIPTKTATFENRSMHNADATRFHAAV